jgi:hypothetical protein
LDRLLGVPLDYAASTFGAVLFDGASVFQTLARLPIFAAIFGVSRPTRATIDQLRITREGNDAVIDYADAGIAGTRVTIGPDIATMTDREIIDVFNGILAAQKRLLAAWDKAVTEEPPGKSKSTITKIAISGSRAATCSAASSTTRA